MKPRPPLDLIPDVRGLFDRPLFIVSSPRSGSTLLFETLCRSTNLFSIGGESHATIEGLVELTPRAKDWHSNRLLKEDVSDEVSKRLAWRFYQGLVDRKGNRAAGQVRMLEKTPKNALRIPFLAEIFPDAQFLFLYRQPLPTVASMAEAWESGYFRTYSNLPGWTGPPWSLVLTPNWRELDGKSLPQIVASQWAATLKIMIGDLLELSTRRLAAISYDDLISRPRQTLERLANRFDFKLVGDLTGELPLSRTTVSKPSRVKSRAYDAELAMLQSVFTREDEAAQDFLRDHSA